MSPAADFPFARIDQAYWRLTSLRSMALSQSAPSRSRDEDELWPTMKSPSRNTWRG